jgi:hypothetical protein
MSTVERPPAPPASIWIRLSRNQALNSPLFRSAGIDTDEIATLHCPHCGLEESALFWDISMRRGPRLRLACPVCTRRGGTYNLRRNRGRGPVNLFGLLAAIVISAAAVALAAALLVRYPPPMTEIQYTLERGREQAAAIVNDTRDWAAQLRRGRR